jgi:dTDP-4-dehydrorhamnose reductase
MKPRILLTGKTGQIGAELAILLPRIGEVSAPDRNELNLLNPGDISRVIREVRPHLILNAAAYTAVDQAEKEEDIARAINAEAPARMAEEARKIGAGIVHYSTDYVFDGSQHSPYGESETPNPVSAYGRTKLAGEQAIREGGLPHLILRTAWVYATRGRNFLLTILRLASQREELRIVHDQIGAPTWCREIARGTVSILERSLQVRGTQLPLLENTGTYHMTAEGATSWYEFACAILEEAAKAPQDLPWFASATNGRPILARRIIPITTPEYPTPASRPPYSVLSNSLLTQTFALQLPDWRVQLHCAFGETPSNAF